jgi:hypothetical protein
MMLRRYLVLLIVLGTLEPALACSIIPPRREIQVEIVQGLGGDCYYKRIPQPEKTSSWRWRESWRTEFYRNAESERPLFTRIDYYSSDIVCLEDKEGSKFIGYVVDKAQDGESYPLNSKSWLIFFVDGQAVASYTPIDLIMRSDNSYYDVSCGSGHIYLDRIDGFIIDGQTNSYVYQVQTFDGHIIRFDLSTGERLSTEQSPEVLLMDAIRSNDVELVEQLLSQGADPNKGNIADGTPLYLATKLSSMEIVGLLLNVGAETDNRKIPQDPYNVDPENNAVYLASKEGNLEIVGLLLESGANPDQPNYDEFALAETPLDIAIVEQHIEIVQYLLEHGAKFTDKTLELAESSGNTEMIELVSSYTPR